MLQPQARRRSSFALEPEILTLNQSQIHRSQVTEQIFGKEASCQRRSLIINVLSTVDGTDVTGRSSPIAALCYSTCSPRELYLNWCSMNHHTFVSSRWIKVSLFREGEAAAAAACSTNP